MASSLARALLETHALAPRPRAWVHGAEVAVRPDHVLLSGHAATLALQAFTSLQRPRAPFEALIVTDGDEPPGSLFERGDERRFRIAAARRAGAWVARPAAGPAHQLHLARFAAPGRLVLGGARGAAVAGGVAALVLAASEIETGTVLAGAPVTFSLPALMAVRLAGTLPPWLDGHDLAAAIAVRLPPLAAPVLLEFDGPGVAALAVADRCALARATERLGPGAALFPSDDRTRAWLAAQGREPDWKPLASGAQGEALTVAEIDLDTLEPAVVDAGGRVRAFDEPGAVPVTRVVVGPDAGPGELLRFAALLGGGTPAAGVEVVLHPGTRAIAQQLAQAGVAEALAAAGVRVLHPAAPPVAAAARGVTVACGVPDGVASAAMRGTLLHASIPTCAASALAGRLADPRELRSLATAVDPPGIAADEPWLARPGGDAASGADLSPGAGAPTLPPLPEARPLAGPLRGPVLIALRDRASARRILPEGDRVWRHRGDIAALAGHAFADADPGFAARARAAGGGFVVAGEEFGHGARQPHATLALVALGVRAVLARSFAQGCRTALVRHGVLPLAFAVPGDVFEVAAGDELEIPGLPEGLEPRKPLVVRDLTRGAQVLARHDLEARDIEIVRAGGWIAAVRAGAAHAVEV